MVWTGDDIDRLSESLFTDTDDAKQSPASESPSSDEESIDGAPRHASKYRRLWQWLTGPTAAELSLTFGEIEEVIGMPRPTSCRPYATH